MGGGRRNEDFSTLLLLVPFIASGAYAIYLWVSSGLTPLLPTGVYLNVTRDPYIFLAGILAVLVGLIVDLNGTGPSNRHGRLAANSSYLQKTAAACFLLSLIMAWYANGFVNVLGAAQDFVVGRYSIIFPTLLVLLSFLINPSLNLRGAASAKFLGFLAILSVPAVVYEVGKRNAVVGLSGAAVIMVVGLYLLLRKVPQPDAKETR
jgi:hypothetical protein